MAFKLVTSVELFCCLVSWLVLIRLGLVARLPGLPELPELPGRPVGSSRICRSCRAAVGIVPVAAAAVTVLSAELRLHPRHKSNAL